MDKVLTAIAGAFVLLPGTVSALVPEAASDPRIMVVLIMLAAVGAAILKQSPPALQRDSGLSDDDVKRIAAEQERLRLARVKAVREAGQRG